MIIGILLLIPVVLFTSSATFVALMSVAIAVMVMLVVSFGV